ncbi:MAG: hypothetical protein M3441_02565 [Chloroflexota bacterium]|nr:hypothetical protein [Chloroflexota bacterium]
MDPTFTASERLKQVKSLIELWHMPISDDDGFSSSAIETNEMRLGHKLPLMLAQWYRYLGRRSDLTCSQNCLVPLDELRIQNGFLVFYVENQAVATWGIPIPQLSSIDPPVLVTFDTLGPDSHASWIQENSSLTEFLFQMMVLETITLSRFSFTAENVEPTITMLKRTYPMLDLPTWHWPSYPTRFYGGQDVLAMTAGKFDIVVAARSAKALAQAASELGVALD